MYGRVWEWKDTRAPWLVGRDRGIERGVVWTDWGYHGNPAAKIRQGQCGREAVYSKSEGMPPRGLLANCTNDTQASSTRVLAEFHPENLHVKNLKIGIEEDVSLLFLWRLFSFCMYLGNL